MIGVETGGLEEFDTTVNAPGVQSSIVRSGEYSVILEGVVGAPPGVRVAKEVFPVSDSGDDRIFGFGFRINDATPSSDIKILDTDGNMSLNLFANGTLALVDANSTEVGSKTNAFVTDEWHYIVIYWIHKGDGRAVVWIDGFEVIRTGTEDFFNAAFGRYQLSGPNFTGVSIFIDDIYSRSQSATEADVLLDANIFAYQKTDGLATEIGDTLVLGTYALISQTPLNQSGGNIAAYDTGGNKGGCDTDSGLRPGPSGDSRIDRSLDIKATRYIYVMRRSSGAGTQHLQRIGNDVDGMTEIVVDMGTIFILKQYLTIEPTIMPEADEVYQMGFGNNAGGSQSTQCAEMWAMLLHSPQFPAVDLSDGIKMPRGLAI